MTHLEQVNTAEACHLGALGFSMRIIQDTTGFTENQIVYKLHKKGIRLSDYKNKKSKLARVIHKSARKAVALVFSKSHAVASV